MKFPLDILKQQSPAIKMIIGAIMISFSGVYVKLANVTPEMAGFYRVFIGGLILSAIKEAAVFSKQKLHCVQPFDHIFFVICFSEYGHVENRSILSNTRFSKRALLAWIWGLQPGHWMTIDHPFPATTQGVICGPDIDATAHACFCMGCPLFRKGHFTHQLAWGFNHSFGHLSWFIEERPVIFISVFSERLSFVSPDQDVP